MDLNFYKGKRVLVTGHTGFKGAWMCRVLVDAGAILTGYSLEAPTQPNLFALAGVEDNMTSIIGDVREDGLSALIEELWFDGPRAEPSSRDLGSAWETMER